MRISIGANMRRLRQEKGLTQEQLAEVFHISAQAVSRWENDQAYPDVTLLPGLAMYYGVSIDEILGMDRIRKAERLHGIMNEIYTLAREGEMDRAIELARESLRVYPDNASLLMALSEALARKSEDEAACGEAIEVSERVLEHGDISMKARSTTAVNLLFLYMRAGEREKAKGLTKTLPHLWESREMVMPEVYEGEEYREALKGSMRKALIFLCLKAEQCGSRKMGEVPGYVQLGVEFENGMDDKEMLKRIGEFLEG